MPVYDLTRSFCDEPDVRRVGGYDWGASSKPTADEVEQFAYSAASQIVMATQLAGKRVEPPASAVADSNLGRTLLEANATGAAYMAWRVMAAKNPDQFAVQMRDQLREDWIQFIGGTAANGQAVRGTIAQAIETASGSRHIANDVTEGETILPTHLPEERPAAFTMTDRL